MTPLASLVDDEEARRREFPICRRKAYFAHAAVAPLPQTVVSAMTSYLEYSSQEGRDFPEVWAKLADVRMAAAQLIGAAPEEIALIGPTSIGLNAVALGLDWKEGDEVVCYADDYAANVYPWTYLRRRGVRVVLLKSETPGAITPALVEAALTAQTRLVALATANFVSGYRIDIDAIGQLLGKRGILFALDAIQSLGAFPISVEHVDFLSCGSQKWLLGPEGSGFFYVKKSRLEQLQPALVGAINVTCPNYVATEEMAFVPGAQRYEATVMDVAGLLGMKAAINLLLDYGAREIGVRILELKRHLVESLNGMGFKVLSVTSGPNASGITTCLHPKVESERLLEALSANQIVVSLRHDRSGSAHLRIAPHFYNTFDEIAKLTDVVRKLV